MRTGHDGATGSGTDAAAELIRCHYQHFNQRRLEDAARAFDADARIEDVTGRVERGPEGYRRFAAAWLSAFPDARLTVQSITRRAGALYDVDLVVSATHTGTLALGSTRLRPAGVRLELRARELLEVKDGRFHLASVAFDVQDLIRQLAPVDTVALLQHVERIHQLGRQLSAEKDAARQRELLDRLGRQLDQARHVVRPYFR
jgi:hypothetical protein